MIRAGVRFKKILICTDNEISSGLVLHCFSVLYTLSSDNDVKIGKPKIRTEFVRAESAVGRYARALVRWKLRRIIKIDGKKYVVGKQPCSF